VEVYVDEKGSVNQGWYACQVRSRAEKKVVQYLGERGFESFLPLMAVKSRWKDRVKVVDLPLFRGYVFARFTVERYASVLSIPGVATIVRHNGFPAAIRDDEIANLRRFAERLMNSAFDPEPVSRFVTGQRVRILAAPFDGKVEGVVTDLRRDQDADVFVGVDLVGQFVRIKVRAQELALVDSDI
jgi:transcription antitermination factor NusG